MYLVLNKNKNKNKKVVYSDKLSGKGLVIQDINAPTSICMEKIIDLKNYNKYVAQVNKVQIYRNLKLPNVIEYLS
jgi:SLT domain-containing protein